MVSNKIADNQEWDQNLEKKIKINFIKIRRDSLLLLVFAWKNKQFFAASAKQELEFGEIFRAAASMWKTL